MADDATAEQTQPPAAAVPVVEGGDGTTPDRPSGSGPSGPRRHRGSHVATELVLALVLLTCAIGIGIGYAVHGASTPSGVTRSTTSTTRTTSLGAATASRIKAQVSPDLVNIYTTLAYATAVGAGTGMVVSSDGLVITNNHVIDGAMRISATDLGNGKTYGVSVVGYDASRDVAVLQLQGASGLTRVPFAGTQVRLGETVVAIGNAGGKGTPTAAAGVVTGLNQTITASSEMSGTTERLHGLIETNAAIRSGQSGGPLADADGRVVGMVTAGSSSFSISQGASQGYAVPTRTFRSITADIVHGRASSTVHIGATAFLGVMVTPIQGAGALVVQVLSTSPAASAGIVAGDVIVGLEGQAVRSPDDLSAVLAAQRPGATLQAQVLDTGGQTRTISVTLVAGPPA